MNLYDLRTAQAKFEDKRVEIFSSRKSLYKLRDNFVKHFSIKRLLNLEIDEYVAGKGDSNTFCNRMERELDPLGRIIGATAHKFGVYYGFESGDDFKKYRYTKLWGNNYKIAFLNIRQAIIELIQFGKLNDLE